MGFLIRFGVTAASLWIAVWLVDGLAFDGNWWQFLLVTAILGVVNAFVKPIVKLFSLPLIAVTLGLFILVINAVLLQLVIWLSGPDVLDLGFTSTGFFWATVLGAIVISVASWVIGLVVPD